MPPRHKLRIGRPPLFARGTLTWTCAATFYHLAFENEDPDAILAAKDLIVHSIEANWPNVPGDCGPALAFLKAMAAAAK